MNVLALYLVVSAFFFGVNKSSFETVFDSILVPQQVYTEI